MSENRKTETEKKIMSFHINEDEMQDPKLDSYVRESLIREADELEEELNRRPDLADVKAPEGMYQAIVEELKKRGAWEEDEESLEALYARLPKEDQEALALGRELTQKKEARTLKRRRRRKVFKIAGVAAACLVVVFGASMTSEANRRLVQKFWDGMMVEFGFKVNSDYTGNKETVQNKNTEEVNAIETISEQLECPTINLAYLPEEMEYRGYDIANEYSASLFYSYRDSLFYVAIMSAHEEGVYYYKYDNEPVFRKMIKNKTGLEAEIWEVNLEMEGETYIAEIEYGNWRYIFNGMISLGELEEIINNFMIL